MSIITPQTAEMLDAVTLSADQFAEIYRQRIASDDVVVIKHPNIHRNEYEALVRFCTELSRHLGNRVVLLPKELTINVQPK